MYNFVLKRIGKTLKRFFSSTYFKAGLTLVLSGVILSMFFKFVNATSFSEGFAKINDTLMPIYIGCAIAFIMCPIYNKLVAVLYTYFTKDTAIGPEVFVKSSHNSADVDAGTDAVSDKAGADSRTGKVTTQRARQKALTASRVIATIVCVFIIVGLIALFAYFVMPQIIENIVNLINTMPERLEKFSEWSDEHLSRFPQIAEAINNLANAGTAEVVEWVQEHVFQSSDGGSSLAQIISDGVFSVISAVIDMFVGLLLSIYLLNYKEKLFAIARKLISSMFSEKRAKGLYEFAGIINETFIGFIVGRILDAIVIGVLTYIVLRIVGINMPLLIAVIVGVTNVIPFFGPFLGAIPSFLLILLDNPIQSLEFLVIILVIQQLDGNVIGPKIVGSAIGLPSFWVLIAVLVGGGVFGFIGMLLGTPIFTVIYRYVDRLAQRRLTRKGLAADTDYYYNLDGYNINKSEIFGHAEEAGADEIPE